MLESTYNPLVTLANRTLPVAISVICQGSYSYNDDSGIRKPCPLRDGCFRYAQRFQQRGVDDDMMGPYDPDHASCEWRLPIGKS